jgi:hypothetical protein
MSIGTLGANTVNFKYNNSNVIQVNGSTLQPVTDLGYSSGSALNRWSTMFTNNLQIGANGLLKGNGTGSNVTAATANTDYLPVNSPTMTGTPTAPTAATATNTTQIATTAFVKAQGYGDSTVFVTKSTQQDINSRKVHLANAIANSNYPIAYFSNRTAATSSVSQNSPQIRFEGSAWGTTAGASQKQYGDISLTASNGTTGTSKFQFNLTNGLGSYTPLQMDNNIAVFSGGVQTAASSLYGANLQLNYTVPISWLNSSTVAQNWSASQDDNSTNSRLRFVRQGDGAGGYFLGNQLYDNNNVAYLKTTDGRTANLVSASVTMVLNNDYLNTTATQYTLTLPTCGSFTTDGSKIITVLSTGTGGAIIRVPSGYAMQSGTSFATTTGTGGATLTQGQKVQLIPIGTNTYYLQPLNGSITLY